MACRFPVQVQCTCCHAYLLDPNAPEMRALVVFYSDVWLQWLFVRSAPYDICRVSKPLRANVQSNKYQLVLGVPRAGTS